jgi:uncharacterized protein (DUF1778 family)
MTSVISRREQRFEVRVTAQAKALLKRAALAQGKTVSAYVLDSSLAAAAEALADRREFRLTAKQYDAFVAALDAPIKAKPRLDRLLQSRSAIE